MTNHPFEICTDNCFDDANSFRIDIFNEPFTFTIGSMKSTKLECYGDLDQVFPMSEDGLRHSPERCMACNEKSQCLKTAIAGKNQIIVAEEKLDRAYQTGRVSFLQRWSKKKTLYNRRREI